MAARVLLLADDLTGACDAAVHFAVRGLRTSAAVSLECAGGDMAVLAINLESRHLERAEIERLMERAAALLPLAPQTVIFKKIDSTLRGNAGIETAEAMRAFGCDAAVFTPALPALGRTVENGILRIHGGSPIDVRKFLREQGAAFECADAACDADLDRIVADALASGRRILWAGSAGLAAALARALPAEAGTGGPPFGADGPVVFAIGSTHPATVAQVEALAAPENPGGRVLFPVPRGKVTAEEVRAFVAARRPAALVLSGGDTASLVCRALGAAWIDLAREIIPGVPCGVLREGLAGGVAVATKSGGFGAPDALIQVADFFRCLKSQKACPPSR